MHLELNKLDWCRACILLHDRGANHPQLAIAKHAVRYMCLHGRAL